MAVAPRTPALLAAVKSSDVDALRMAIARGGDPNARDPGGWTPLGFAIMRGDVESVRLLVDAGAHIELSIDVDGPVQTPLRFAEEFWGRKEIGAFLRSRGALPWAPRPPSPPVVWRRRPRPKSTVWGVRPLSAMGRTIWAVPGPRPEAEPEPAVATRVAQVLGGLMLVALGLSGLVGCVASLLLLIPHAKATLQGAAVTFWMLAMFAWVFKIGARLVFGSRVLGDLMEVRLFRAFAWVSLLLPVGGLYTGWFATDMPLATVESVACVGAFLGLRLLADRRAKRDARARAANAPFGTA